MPNDLFQSATWPGVAAVESCQYVCSHGITPGRAVLVTYPQAAAPREFGDLTFSDGRRSVVIPGCKADRVTPEVSANGVTYTLEILDTRWQWAGLGGISGRYNQRDDRGKLVPWTIRSPKELAAVCLRAMGVPNSVVRLPEGLGAAAGRDLDRYLRLGENFPQTLTNPEVVWDHTPPAEALARLADLYGCRVIYQPLSRRVLVAPLGRGAPLPAHAAEVIGATIDGPEAPAFVGVFGAPVKIQARFALEAVGEEWDGSYVPIDRLSYAPVTGQDRPQVSHVRYLGGESLPLSVLVSFADPRTGERVEQRGSSTGPGVSVADRFAAVRRQLLANPGVARNLTVAADAVTLVLTGKAPFDFGATCFNPSGGDEGFQAEVVQRAVKAATASWATSHPPQFTNVQATDRLSYTEARALARKTVFRCYRILARDPHDMGPRDKPGRPLKLPWWGTVARRQQVLLQDTKVAQVVPQPRIPGAVNKGNREALAAPNIPGQGVLPEFYNGYSRDQVNTVSGSIHFAIGNASWMFVTTDNKQERFNTEPDARVFVNFSVNQVEQMIVFDEPVYMWGPGQTALEPVLTLEAGCFVLHPETNQVVRWEEVLPVPGGVAPVEWHHREDVQVGVVGEYGREHQLLGFGFADLADARARAGYYLRGQASRYQITGGETRQYVGILRHEPDGYTQQVSWSVGPGATTVVSANTEFHPAIPPYPARRRAENLTPDRAAAAANIQERELWHEVAPKEVQ